MEPTAIILVVISALLHSIWNLLSKKGKNKLVFNWYILLSGPIIYSPVFLYLLYTEQIPTIGWLFITLSGIFIAFYFYFLGKSYSYGHLSLTYPIARSSAIFVPLLALILIDERLSFIGILGIIVILIGAYLLHLRSFRLKSFLEPLKYIKEKATIFAFLTALFSALYSITDKIAVNYVYPFLYIYMIYLFASVFYIPVILFKKNRADLTIEWKNNKKLILFSAFLSIMSYLLILFAFRIDKVSYIVSLRQLSVVFGVILSIIILKEKYGKIRLVASAIMLMGFLMVGVA